MSTLDIPPIDELWPNPILRFKDRGSSSRELIYLSVGRVCSTWEIIEANLGLIFGQFAESHSSASQRAYGVISTTNGRREALEMAAEIYHDRHYQFPITQFKSLMSHYAKASSYRNKIAHGVATEFSNEKGISSGCFLVPSFFSSKHNPAKTSSFWKKAQESEDEFYVFGNGYRYTHEDIDLLESKLQQFSELLAKCLGYLIQSEIERSMQSGQRFMHDIRPS